uniref:NADH dehydrogenase subunit 1 n=1 Tax=Gunungiella wangi TaxID=3025506 RepID=UPI0024348637|nr:NADH dehydrogenase subunit 1 [Gunungiella wangi]WEU80075.1 NADH dehydrogenase subunit 1 [Gunungiella wangi]
MEMWIFFCNFLLLIIMVLLSVAFFTLLERKILGYVQIRKGPNKVGLMGIFQPFSDAIKLFTKEQVKLVNSNYLVYYFMPVMNLIIAMISWMLMTYLEILIYMNMGFVFMVCILGVGVYMIMVAGWSSNSNYAMLGSMRAIVQTISYEVSMVMLMLSSIMLLMSFNLLEYYFYQKFIWFFLIMMPVGFMMLGSMLAEVNRTPFDFAEGESELVSGFNIEYGSGGFALIFLSEYSMIMFMSMIFSVMFLGAYFSLSFMLMTLVGLCVIFIWVRGILPRYRYDKLMYLTWKIYLPLSLFFLVFFLGFIVF